MVYNMTILGGVPEISSTPYGGEIMGKASTRAQNRYIAKAYDRINLTVPKGKKDIIQAHAEANDESVNGFINRAIDQTMAREATGSSTRDDMSRTMLDITEGGEDILGPSEDRTEGNSNSVSEGKLGGE